MRSLWIKKPYRIIYRIKSGGGSMSLPLSTGLDWCRRDSDIYCGLGRGRIILSKPPACASADLIFQHTFFNLDKAISSPQGWTWCSRSREWSDSSPDSIFKKFVIKRIDLNRSEGLRLVALFYFFWRRRYCQVNKKRSFLWGLTTKKRPGIYGPISEKHSNPARNKFNPQCSDRLFVEAI